MQEIDADKFAAGIVGALSAKIDATHAPLQIELTHIRRAQISQGLAIARIETKQDAQDANNKALERRVTELEKIDRSNQRQLGKLSAISAGAGGIVGGIVAWFCKHP